MHITDENLLLRGDSEAVKLLSKHMRREGSAYARSCIESVQAQHELTGSSTAVEVLMINKLLHSRCSCD